MNALTAARPSLRSLMIERPITTPAAAVNPCTNRNAINTVMLGATAQPMLAIVQMDSAIRRGRRRP